MYYAVSTFGSNTSAIGLATSQALAPRSGKTREWSSARQAAIITTASILTLFRTPTDHSWLVFGSFWSGIKLVQIDTLTGKPPTATPSLTSLAARSGGSTAIEAPFIVNGNLLLFVRFMGRLLPGSKQHL